MSEFTKLGKLKRKIIKKTVPLLPKKKSLPRKDLVFNKMKITKNTLWKQLEKGVYNKQNDKAGQKLSQQDRNKMENTIRKINFNLFRNFEDKVPIKKSIKKPKKIN